jgi:hypothetical protein
MAPAPSDTVSSGLSFATMCTSQPASSRRTAHVSPETPAPTTTARGRI